MDKIIDSRDINENNGEITALDIATWFLNRESMSHKKMQKLIYYAYAWTLTLLNESAEDINNRLFNENIEAWIHGPVIPEVYKVYKDYKWTAIPRENDLEINLSEDVEDVLNQVWDIYGGYTANELESITHQEDPWIKAREGLASNEIGRRRLSDEHIFNYYSNI